jgi:hypothetical protein
LLFSQAAFPEFDYGPASGKQQFSVSVIPLYIFFELLYPESSSGRRGICISAASVAVPEAAMHENTYAVLGQNNIGLARKVLAVKAIAKPMCMQSFSDFKLRLRIFPLDCGHIT